MTDKEFEVILSKNRIARHIKDIHMELNEVVPEHIKFDFDEIEKITGTANQPTGRDIMSTSIDI